MPPSCRASDGTEDVERYDHRMDEWIPLFASTVTVLGALAVALWNSRGESRDVRQLKAMNDVIAGLPADAEATAAFKDARDGMLVRVAAGVASLPRRRRITWSVVGLVLAAATLVFVGWLITPLIAPALSAGAIEWMNAAAAFGTAAVAFAGMLWSRRQQKLSAEQEAADVAALLATFNEARAFTRLNE